MLQKFQNCSFFQVVLLFFVNVKEDTVMTSVQQSTSKSIIFRFLVLRSVCWIINKVMCLSAFTLFSSCQLIIELAIVMFLVLGFGAVGGSLCVSYLREKQVQCQLFLIFHNFKQTVVSYCRQAACGGCVSASESSSSNTSSDLVKMDG